MPDIIYLTFSYRLLMSQDPQKTHRDQLFANLVAEPSQFSFNEAVVDVFPDMIQRSVPGYGTVVRMTGVLTEQYAKEGTHVYDLGCSLGESIRAAELAIGDRACQLVGVDNSPAMIEKVRAEVPPRSKIMWHLSDITQMEFKTASVVIMNFTLQFIPINERLKLLKQIRSSMVPGGLLILSEKLTMPDAEMNELMVNLHHDFKRSQGYSGLEIAQKRDAIDNVLIPETAEVHRIRLTEAGFSRSSVWFQCLNFASLIAIA
ncbi:carboxy-S-adenosyl-L-methionine synthase CmoA [Luminiphilus sp.]|jgi:tRNA (cmo5U34)-methyltransferase|nr:carboxy-S-adenosyl-L-methionine synthase CmoA [Luminiphilus sp.]